MQETGVQSLDWEDPLKKRMAPHSSILAWRILWTEEPGRLQSMGSQRVRHNWATKHKISQMKWHLGWDLIGKKELLAKALELAQGIWGSESSQWREILVYEAECETRWGWPGRQGPDVAASQRPWLGAWNLSWIQWWSMKGYFQARE